MKKFGKLLWLSITAIVVLFFLVSSATAYISPIGFPLATLFSIAYLPILSAYFILTVCWFFKSKRFFLILLLLLLSGYRNLTSSIAVNFLSDSWKNAKAEGTVRVMSWNVNTFGDPFVINDTLNSSRQKLLEIIRSTNADVLCIQDLGEKRQTADKRFVQNVEDIMKAGGFSSVHYSFFYEFEGYKHAKLGAAIFTKLPVLDTGSFNNNGSNKYERTGFADVLFLGKPIRLINSHLSSMSLWPSNKQEAGINYLEGDSTKTKAKSIFRKLTDIGSFHTKEAKLIKSFMDSSSFPVLFCADLNSVPSSYVYHHLKQNLSDAFLEKDIGIGGTYNRVFPKLRIDVMLYSKELEVVQFTRPAVDLSDHYPIIADIRWKQ